jgi:hypothetical protein
MRRGDSRFIPRLPNVDQKLRRLRLCRDCQDPTKRTETHFGSTYSRRTLRYVVTRERRSSRPFGRGSNIPSQKKARQAISCSKNISSQGVPSSRWIFDSAALHSGPKAFVEGDRRQRPNKWRLLYMTTRHPTPLCTAVFNRNRHGRGLLSDCTPTLSTRDFSLFLEMKMLVKRTKMRGVSRRFELNQRRCWKASWDGVSEMLSEAGPALIAVCGDCS